MPVGVLADLSSQVARLGTPKCRAVLVLAAAFSQRIAQRLHLRIDCLDAHWARRRALGIAAGLIKPDLAIADHCSLVADE
jgi:hypothetical protein